jgi:hypothetical protein
MCSAPKGGKSFIKSDMQINLRYFFLAVFTTFVITACGFRAKDFSDNSPVGGQTGGGPPPGTGSTTAGSTGTTTGATGCATNNLVLEWDTSEDAASPGNPDQSVLGHVIYTGPTSRAYGRTYTQSVTPPIVSTYQYPVTGLGLGTYYMTVTAYNATGESGYANEVACNFTACDTPCIVVMSAAPLSNKKLVAPKLELYSEAELKKKKPAIYEKMKKNITEAKAAESYRKTLNVDLPPGDLTLNVEGYKKDWEENEK